MDQVETKRFGPYRYVRSKEETDENDCMLTSPSASDTMSLPLGARIKGILSHPDWIFLACWATFVVLESQYLLLGGMAISYGGLPLHLSWAHQRESKAAFVIITIIWQSLAIFPIQHLVNRVFSAEWHYQFNNRDQRIGNDMDKVSTINSGIKQFVAHFFSKESSTTFRIALVISLVLRLLTGIAPAALGITVDLETNRDIPLKIAKLTVGSNETEDYYGGVIPYLTSRAAAIALLEQRDHRTFGVEWSPDYIFAAPGLSETIPYNLVDPMFEVRYTADVVHFDFACKWMLPDENYRTPESVNLAGLNWTVYLTPEMISAKYQYGVFPLIPTATSPKYRPVNETALSAYVFAQQNNSARIAFNETLPVPTTSANLSSIFPNESGSLFTTYTFLVCDPQPHMTVADIVLGVFGDPDSYYSIKSIDEIAQAYGNGTRETQISLDISNTIFSTALLDATSRGDSGETLATSSMFLTTSSYSIFMEGDFNETFAQAKPLSDIRDQLTEYFYSASKAYTDGYRPLLKGPVVQSTIHPTTISVQASQQIFFNSLGLSTSTRTFYLTIALVSLVAVLTPFLYKGWKREKDYPFTLQSLSEEGILKKQV